MGVNLAPYNTQQRWGSTSRRRLPTSPSLPLGPRSVPNSGGAKGRRLADRTFAAKAEIGEKIGHGPPVLGILTVCC